MKHPAFEIAAQARRVIKELVDIGLIEPHVLGPDKGKLVKKRKHKRVKAA